MAEIEPRSDPLCQTISCWVNLKLRPGCVPAIPKSLIYSAEIAVLRRRNERHG